MTKSTASNKKTVKPRGGSWKRGQSGNPAGRPRAAQSWAGVLRDVTDKTAEELADMAGGKRTDLGKQLLELPKGQPLKYLVAMRVLTALMFEPSGSLLRAIMLVESYDEIEQRLAAVEQLLNVRKT